MLVGSSLLLVALIHSGLALRLQMKAGNNPFQAIFGGGNKQASSGTSVPYEPVLVSPQFSWDELRSSVLDTEEGGILEKDRLLREKGGGLPHGDNEIRLAQAGVPIVRKCGFCWRRSKFRTEQEKLICVATATSRENF